MKLPGEDEIVTVTKKRVRRSCDNCGNPAYYMFTFLLPEARSNPASSAYKKDDVSWSSDAKRFSCVKGECVRKLRQLEGYRWCAEFSAPKFPHMFLFWKEVG